MHGVKIEWISLQTDIIACSYHHQFVDLRMTDLDVRSIACFTTTLRYQYAVEAERCARMCTFQLGTGIPTVRIPPTWLNSKREAAVPA